MHRRDFLAQSLLVPTAFAAWVDAIQEDLWSTASGILARIKPPQFPARDVDLPRHGAKGTARPIAPARSAPRSTRATTQAAAAWSSPPAGS